MNKEELRKLYHDLIFHANLSLDDRVEVINRAILLIDKAYGENAPLTVDYVLNELKKENDLPFEPGDEVLLIAKGTVSEVMGGNSYVVKVVDKYNKTIDMFTHDGKMREIHTDRQLFNLSKKHKSTS